MRDADLKDNLRKVAYLLSLEIDPDNELRGLLLSRKILTEQQIQSVYVIYLSSICFALRV